MSAFYDRVNTKNVAGVKKIIRCAKTEIFHLLIF
jgi:hypothetical protein